jgi:adenosylcobinamide amidohydrolase
VLPELHERQEGGRSLGMLVWRFPEPLLAISSAPYGGGIGRRAWVINAQVQRTYDRVDLREHVVEMARGVRLAGPGAGMLTAADINGVVHADDGGVLVAATVGLSHPTWAAAPDEAGGVTVGGADPVAGHPGTINVVAVVPAALADQALVNAVATVAEAKAQALADVGVPGTGTPTDALVIACGGKERPVPFGGPRSRWGSSLARAVHAAVTDGARRWVDEHG